MSEFYGMGNISIEKKKKKGRQREGGTMGQKPLYQITQTSPSHSSAAPPGCWKSSILGAKDLHVLVSLRPLTCPGPGLLQDLCTLSGQNGLVGQETGVPGALPKCLGCPLTVPLSLSSTLHNYPPLSA